MTKRQVTGRTNPVGGKSEVLADFHARPSHSVSRRAEEGTYKASAVGPRDKLGREARKIYY